MEVCIVGLGLLGGSLGLAIKKAEAGVRVLGVDTNPLHEEKALSMGIADETGAFEDLVPRADIVILATPVDIIALQVTAALDILKEGAVLSDFGSAKRKICATAERNNRRDWFVAAHPIAGTEDSGPQASFAGLLAGKMMIICDREKCQPEALEKIEKLYTLVGMKLVYMSSSSHDSHIAYVSHLSHISSFALGGTVLDKERNEKNIFNMAGSGFSSTVRLAKSSPDMWAPIFGQNKENITEALTNYIDRLENFRNMLEKDDREGIYQFMKEANDIRRVLEGK